MSKLTLRGTEIVFTTLVDGDFKRSITIKVSEDNAKLIRDYWKAENIGNGKSVKIGEPNFKDYEGTTQLLIPFNDVTKFHYLDGLTSNDLGFGAKCDMMVNSFEYNNKFTKGKTYKGVSISAVIITKGRSTGADADLEELLMGRVDNESEPIQDESDESIDPILDKGAVDDLPF